MYISFFSCYRLYMRRPSNGSTIKQVAYARKLFNGEGKTKKEIARSVGYSPAMANNVVKIEESEGFHIAMMKLAHESNNLVLAALEEYKLRGLGEFSNKDLNGALNAIASAWDRISKQRAPNATHDPEKNPLRKVFMQKVENQTINVAPAGPTQPAPVLEPIPTTNIDMDF